MSLTSLNYVNSQVFFSSVYKTTLWVRDSNIISELSFAASEEKFGFFIFPLGGGQIHCVSISQPLRQPLSNSGFMIVILKQSELSKQKQPWWMPRCSVLVCFGLAWSGAGIEFNAYLFRCISVTEAALLYSSRQHWLNGNSPVIWIKMGGNMRTIVGKAK